MARRVHEDHHPVAVVRLDGVRGRRRGVDDLEHRAARRAVGLPVERGGHDVGEAAQRVEVVLLVVVERRLVPQPPPDVMGGGVDHVVVRVVGQIGRSGCHEGESGPRLTGYSSTTFENTLGMSERLAERSGRPTFGQYARNRSGTVDARDLEHRLTKSASPRRTGTHPSGAAEDRPAGPHRPGHDRPGGLRGRPRSGHDEGGRRPPRRQRARALPPRAGPRGPDAAGRGVLCRAAAGAGRPRAALVRLVARVGDLQPRRLRRATGAARASSSTARSASIGW